MHLHNQHTLPHSLQSTVCRTINNPSEVGKLSSINPFIGGWNVENVTDMYFMFCHARAFNQPIGEWKVGKVTCMAHMFEGTKKFNQPIGHWNVSQVTCMNSMFYEAIAFNQPIVKWNVEKVTSMTCMFSYAKAFNQPTHWRMECCILYCITLLNICIYFNYIYIN